MKDFRSVAKFFSKTTTTMFWLPKQVRTFFLTYYLSIFLELIVTYSYSLLTRKLGITIMCNSTIKLGMVLSMNNEKILEAARKNKNRGKEFEQKESTRSSLLGTLVALLVGIGLFLLEYFINDTVNIGFIAVGMTASGVQSLYEGLKVRKLSLTVIGAIQTLIALIAILAFVGQVVLQ